MTTTQATNPSGSHLPIVGKLLTHTNGPILEMGSGFFSTPILYWSAMAKGQPFRSYEGNKDWAELMGDPVKYVADWKDANIKEFHWAVAFIDHGDAILRKDHAVALKDSADFIVLHDSEPKNDRHYKFSEIYNQFTYRFDFDAVMPYTTIVSNKINLDFLKS
jgi:hypothetical protein